MYDDFIHGLSSLRFWQLRLNYTIASGVIRKYLDVRKGSAIGAEGRNRSRHIVADLQYQGACFGQIIRRTGNNSPVKINAVDAAVKRSERLPTVHFRGQRRQF